ncbi:MAG: hypothetical protein CVU39_06715 [Chloroflexi bacterium HGW-Chloroflexi-10]|nr:MAG: hypothetical protein CVU39_06715 [Chloroflexi bacterium HGW-Chloroflexi-10]
MKRIFNIAWTDIKIEFSEKSTLVFFLILPLIFTTIIGIGLKNTFSDDADADPRLALPVVNLDGGTYANELLAFMQSSDNTRPVEFDLASAENQFAGGDISAYLVIPSGFSEQAQNTQGATLVFFQAPGSTNAIGLQQDILASTRKLNALISITSQSIASAEEIQPFNSDADRTSYQTIVLENAREALNNPQIYAKSTSAATAQTKIPNGFEQSSPGQLVTWVLTTLLGGAEVFVNERLGGTLRRLVITPTRKAVILAGKCLGRLTLGLVQMTLLVGFGALVLGVNWGQDPWALLIMLVAFGLAGTALGVMLGAFARTRSQASGLSILFSMLLAALGGAWWPLEITPQGYQTAVSLLPSTWAMRGFNDVIVRGQNVSAILPEAGILLGFAVIFFVVGIWKLKFE